MKRFFAFCGTHTAACCALLDLWLSFFLFYLFRRALQRLCGALLFDFLARGGAAAVLGGTAALLSGGCSAALCYLLLRARRGGATPAALRGAARLYLFGTVAAAFSCAAAAAFFALDALHSAPFFLLAKALWDAAALLCRTFFQKPLCRIAPALFSGQKPTAVFRHSPFFETLLRAAGFLILALMPLYCTLMMEAVHFPLCRTTGYGSLRAYFSENGNAFLFAAGVVCVFYLLLLLLCKKGWIAAGILLFFSTAMMTVNYYKFTLTGDFFYPWDLGATKNMGELFEFVRTAPSKRMLFFVALGILLIVIAALSRLSLPLRFSLRAPLAALLVFGAVFSASTPARCAKILAKNNLYFEDMSLQYSNYAANGFVGGFFVNALSMNVSVPQNYSEQTVNAILDNQVDSSPSDSFSSPDIILVLSESFWDVRRLPGTTFSENPLQNYDALCADANTVSGDIVQSAFGGGTVRPEFDILTGLSVDALPSGAVPWQYVSEQTPSYPALFRSLGYRTLAVHPYTATFYDRRRAYPLIGIEEAYFSDDMKTVKEIEPHIRGKQISDASFVEYIKYYMEHSDSDAPVFCFGISMENHQAYEHKFSDAPYSLENPDFSVYTENPALDEATMESLGNYVQGLKDADDALGELAEYVKTRDRNTVLIWFGDHLPTLGTNRAAYVQSGMISQPESASDSLALRHTPFLIYANFPLKESTIVQKGAENLISDYHLLGAACEMIGAPGTRLTAFLQRYAAVQPYYCAAVRRAVNADEAVLQFAEQHRLLTYDRLFGKQYSAN